MSAAYAMCQRVVDKAMARDAVALIRQHEEPPAELATFVRAKLPGPAEAAALAAQPNPTVAQLEEMQVLASTADASFAEQLLRRRTQHVLLVADSERHAAALRALLLAAGATAGEVLVFDGGLSADFTEQNATAKSPRVLVVPKSRCAGWNGTRFTVLMRGVYFGNQASRSQMEGRIDRLSCVRKVRYVRTYAAGVQERFLLYQQKASSLAKAIQLACPSS